MIRLSIYIDSTKRTLRFFENCYALGFGAINLFILRLFLKNVEQSSVVQVLYIYVTSGLSIEINNHEANPTDIRTYLGLLHFNCLCILRNYFLCFLSSWASSSAMWIGHCCIPSLVQIAING